MNLVITVGRQYGSGGRYIAKELAKRLNIAYYDHELIEKVSEESGLCVDFLKKNDERRDSIFSYVAVADQTNFMTASQTVALAEFDMIKKIAAQESCVIVGRCADYVLRDVEGVCNIFIHAPKDDRFKRVTKYYDIPASKALDTMSKMDKKRAGYYAYYTDKKWGHASNYDLTINSSIGIEESVDVIIALLKKKVPEFFK